MKCRLCIHREENKCKYWGITVEDFENGFCHKYSGADEALINKVLKAAKVVYPEITCLAMLKNGSAFVGELSPYYSEDKCDMIPVGQVHYIPALDGYARNAKESRRFIEEENNNDN